MFNRILLGILAVSCATSAFAANVVSNKSGDFGDPETWNSGYVPVSGDKVFIRANRTVTLGDGVSYGDYAEVWLANQSTGTAALAVTNGTISGDAMYVGAADSSVNPTFATLSIGGGLSAATVSFSSVTVAARPSSEAFAEVKANGLLTAQGIIIGGSTSARAGLLVSGGMVQAPTLTLGANASTGVLTIAGGTVSVSATKVGVVTGGMGGIAVSSGTLTVANSILYIGERLNAATTSGTFSMTGGRVDVGVNSLALGAGNSATQVINSVATISGGTFTGKLLLGRGGSANSYSSAMLTIGADANISYASEEVVTAAVFDIRYGSTVTWKADKDSAAFLDFSKGRAAVVANQAISLDLTDFTWSGSGIGDTLTLQLLAAASFSSGTQDNFANAFEVIGYNTEDYSVVSGWGIGGLAENVFGVTITNLNVIPEPSAAAALLGLGALLLAVRRRR